MVVETQKTEKQLASEVNEQRIIEKLRELDFQLWYKRSLIKPARLMLEKQLGLKISARAFKRLRKEHCQWWKKERRPSPCKSLVLDASGWDRLRAAVREQALLIQGRSLGEAVAVVSLICPCNKQLLSGLNRDLHLWEKRKAPQ